MSPAVSLYSTPPPGVFLVHEVQDTVRDSNFDTKLFSLKISSMTACVDIAGNIVCSNESKSYLSIRVYDTFSCTFVFEHSKDNNSPQYILYVHYYSLLLCPIAPFCRLHTS